MTHHFSRSVATWWWLLTLAVLIAALGWEFRRETPTSSSGQNGRVVAPTSGLPAVLPEYGIDGGIAGHSETVQRTLFNPTRRPAPVIIADASDKPMFQKGQFTFLGTTLTGDRRIAFLREVAGGKSRIVGQGDQINGVTVAAVSADRVKLQSGAQIEELRLSALADPGRSAIQPQPLIAPTPVPVPAPAEIASYPKDAPVTPPTSPEPATLLEEGQPVPNPD